MSTQNKEAAILELHGIVHFLLTEQRCPVMLDGKLAYVRCPGVSKESFKLAIDRRVVRNLVADLDHHLPPNRASAPTCERRTEESKP